MIKQLIEEEMARTIPPPHCKDCTCDGDCESQIHIQDNRHELYRNFLLVESEFKGVFRYVCKDCQTTAFVREGLYRITDDDGKSRLAWVAESARCLSCGNIWRRKERERLTKLEEDGGWR